jgi:hypothetical protein
MKLNLSWRLLFAAASIGLISRVPATDIESIIVTSLNEHMIAQNEKPASSRTHVRDSKAALEQVARIDVYEDRLAVRLNATNQRSIKEPQGLGESVASLRAECLG